MARLTPIVRTFLRNTEIQTKYLFTRNISKSTKTLDLSGIYPPIATPFHLNESLHFEKLSSNFAIWNKIPFSGYLVEGSNGEYVYLTQDERVELVKRVRELLPPGSDKLLLAGSACESTKETINMSNLMSEAGADAVMVVTPNYYKGSMKDKALFHYYKEVADHTDVPVILYSVPPNTNIDLSADVVADLADHPNIIGMKDSGGDISKLGSMVHRTKKYDFQILAGSASFLLAALQLGCVGGVCALANMLGEEVCKLQQLYNDGRIEEAVLLQHKLIAPNAAVTKVFGVAGLKHAMDMLGLYGGPTRKPLLPLSDPEKIKLKEVFVNAGYL